MPQSFGNAGSALSSLGGSMRSAGNKLQSRGNNGGGRVGMSARQHRKMVGNLVDAHRAMNETETLHHGQRLDQSTDAAIKMREAGFANVNAETAHVKIQGTGKAKKASGTKEDAEARAHNPSADIHGHPFAGHPFGNGTRPVIELPASAVISSTVRRSELPAVSSVRPTLALESGKTGYEAQAGTRPGTSAPAPVKPFTAKPSGEVLKPGQRDINAKTPAGPERTFTVGKRGTTRETTPGVKPNAIAKTTPLKAPYDGPKLAVAANNAKTRKKKDA